MSNLNRFEEITPDIIKKCGVQSLADRPNQPSRYGEDGLTAGQLKLRFDRLATEIINKYNLLVETLSTPEKAASYIALRTVEGEVETLADFLASAVGSDAFASELWVNENGETLAQVLKTIKNTLDARVLDITDGDLATNLIVDTEKKTTLTAALRTLDSALTSLNEDIESGELANRMIANVLQPDGNTYSDKVSNHLALLQGEISGAAAAYEDLSGKIAETENSIADIKQDFVSKTAEGEQSLFGALYVPKITASDGAFDDVFVNGDLFVSGTSYAIDKLALTVSDNIIVVNASTQLNYENGKPFANSGIVINTGKKGEDGTYEAYGILYQPNGNDAVYIGKGKLRYEDDDGLKETEYDARTATFTFDEGEAIPLAARSGVFNEGDIPLWDAAKNAFKSSGIGLDEVGRDITEWDYEITDPSQFTTDNLATMSGNILVKCDIEATEEDMSVTIPIGVKLINFNGHRTNYSIAGHQDCRLISAFIGMGVNSYEVYMSNFGSIEFCDGNGCFYNCNRIAHSSIWNASSCSFITDVFTSTPESQSATFYNCSNITNVKVEDVSDSSSMGVEFDSCSNISNVTKHGSADGVITYTNCKYVDAFTCVGYGVGVPYVDASGIVSFLERAEGGSYGS